MPTTPFAPVIEGRYVRLERISAHHTRALWSTLGFAKDSSILDWLPWTKPSNGEELWTMYDRLQQDRGFVIYAIIGSPDHTHAPAPDRLNLSSQEAIGTIGFLNINDQHRTIETGSVLFGSALKRSTAATEAHYLLLRSICEGDNGPEYRRMAWKNNSLNTASRLAAERLGYVYEGTWRNHMFHDGQSRDTDWLSITDAEWPSVKKAFESWLRDENFDSDGKQMRSLGSIREEVRKC